MRHRQGRVSSALVWEAARDNCAGDAVLKRLDGPSAKLVNSLAARERIKQVLNDLRSFPVLGWPSCGMRLSTSGFADRRALFHT